MKPVTVRLRTFAALRDHLGPEFDLEVEPGWNADEILAAVSRKAPAAADLLGASRLAVGDELVDGGFVPAGDQLSRAEFFLLPPASGG